ncbi:CoA-binding protein [Paludibaculum fermentans]|uniref:CoA-binding protein n=1 Tax=Paludibaculum fermentans TaxID=1473598 RepID=A0A7S7NTF7_PALFE|nr:CoA-binding protein [Paludibaculum fermentans]QOY89472.1 CoA-binding protein [Paludibaculum fermentans]
MIVTARADIDEFLALPRIALVGLSREEKHFSRMVYKELLSRGRDVVPVNPEATEIAGVACFPDVTSILPAVQGALIMTAPAVSASVVEDCAAAGVHFVWLYRSVGAGSVSNDALAACEELGMRVVNGECPFMFLPNSGWIHGFHRGIRGLIGHLPN